MSTHHIIAAAESLDAAAFETLDAREREELENLLDSLHAILQRHGVFVGTQFPRPRRGQTYQHRPGGAAPGH